MYTLVNNKGNIDTRGNVVVRRSLHIGGSTLPYREYTDLYYNNVFYRVSIQIINRHKDVYITTRYIFDNARCRFLKVVSQPPDYNRLQLKVPRHNYKLIGSLVTITNPNAELAYVEDIKDTVLYELVSAHVREYMKYSEDDLNYMYPRIPFE